MYTSKLNIKHRRHAEIHWGEHKETGELIWIGDVEANGYACNCKCACCGSDLKACTKGKIQRPHFKHRGNNGCYYSDEIAEYLKACKILTTLSTICLPPVGVRIGRHGEVIMPASEATVQNVLCHHDANHYPPLLTAEIGGQLTRIILSFAGYYDKKDYKEFFQEAHQYNWNCLEILLPRIEDELSVTKKSLHAYVPGLNSNKRWVYHTTTAELAQRLKNAAVELTPTEHRYGTITHIEYSCPLHKREHNGKFYAFQNDCVNCDYNLSISSVCLCLAESQIKTLSDFDIPLEDRKERFIKLQKTNEDSISKQRAANIQRTTAANTSAFDPKIEPGYSYICNKNPYQSSAVYDHFGKRWHWCISCNSWIPQRNMAAYGFSYGPVKGTCKSCNRKKTTPR